MGSGDDNQNKKTGMKSEYLFQQLNEFYNEKDLGMSFINRFKAFWYSKGLEKGAELMRNATSKGKDTESILMKQDFEEQMERITNEMNDPEAEKFSYK